MEHWCLTQTATNSQLVVYLHQTVSDSEMTCQPDLLRRLQRIPPSLRIQALRASFFARGEKSRGGPVGERCGWTSLLFSTLAKKEARRAWMPMEVWRGGLQALRASFFARGEKSRGGPAASPPLRPPQTYVCGGEARMARRRV